MFRRIDPNLYLIALFLIVLLGHSWYGPDIWYHLFWGRDLVANGNWLPSPPVVFAQPIPANPYWLFQAVLYLGYSLGGIYMISLLFAALWMGIVVIWLRLSDVYKVPWGPWIAAAFVICMQLRFEHRPEVISYFFLMLFIFLGERVWTETGWSKVKLLALLVSQVIWANSHGYFVLGPVIAGLMVWRAGGRSKEVAGLTLGLLVLTLVSPFGYKNWESVWLYMQLGRETAEFNSELMAPSFSFSYFPNLIFWISWFATLVMGVATFVKRRDWVLALMVAVGLLLSAQAIRNMPLLFLLTPLVWRGWKLSTAFAFYLRPASFLLAAVLLFLSGSVISGHYHRWVGSLASFGIKLEGASYPIQATKYLKEIGFKGRLFCDSYDGGYLEYHLEGVTVAGDSYFADSEVTKRFFAAIRSPQFLQQVDSQVGFDGFLINIENLEVMDMLLSRPSMVVVHADSHRALFLRQDLVPQGTSGDLTRFQFYHGEDMRHWAYAFGPIAWMGLAAKRQDVGLIKKILTDVGRAGYVPEDLLRIALKFAVDRRDDELVRMLAAIKDRLDGQ